MCQHVRLLNGCRLKACRSWTLNHIARVCAGLFALLIASRVGLAQTPGIRANSGVAAPGVVDVQELARYEELYPASSRAPQAVPRPSIHRRSLPVSTDAGRVAVAHEIPGPAMSSRSSVASFTPALLSPAPAQTFEALMDDQVYTVPDTQGAVGPNDILVVESGAFRVLSRTGAQKSRITLDTFWNSFGLGSGLKPQNSRVIYEPFNNRWIVVSEINANTSTSGFMIAMSKTSDPAGMYYGYRIDSDPGLWSNFPTLGFNGNWVVVSTNMYDLTSGMFKQMKLYAFTKADMLASRPVNYFWWADTVADSLIPAVTFDNNPATPLYLLQSWDGNPGDGFGYLRMGWIAGTTSNPLLYLGPMCSLCIQLSTPWGFYVPPTNGGFAPQAGTSTRIDTLDDRVRSLIYRDGSLWGAETVFLPAAAPTRSAIQWFQFDTSGNGAYQRLDDASANIFRAYPSLTVNKFDDALIGYSTFSASGYPTAAYSFVSHRDPGFGAESEQIFMPGRGMFVKFGIGSTVNDWGFYSHTVMDPSNDADMWTVQEFADFPSSPTYGNWGTWWAKVEVGAAKLQMSNPGSTIAGATFSITVTAQDSSNITVPGYGGTIHLASSDGSAVLPADYTFTAADNGVHTFSGIILYKAGNQSISVGDAAAPASGTGNIQVVPAGPKRFAWNVPLTATLNTPFTGTLTVFDNFSNVATNYTGSVQLSTTGTPAVTLPAPNPYAFNSGDRGIHAFSFTATSGTGNTFTITGNDSGNAVNATSSSIRVTTDLPITATGRRIHMFRRNVPVVVGSFTDSDGGENGTNLSATIDWGDGTAPDSGCSLSSTNCKIVRVGTSNVFNVLGAHSYASKKMFTVTVTLRDNNNGAGNGSAAVATSTSSFFPINSSH